MIFLDSSFLVAVEVKTDQNHEKAIQIRDKIIGGKFGETTISDYIFDETITTTFNKTKNLKEAVFVGTNLQNSAEVIKVDEQIFNEAWNIFKEQKNTKFSFTDCTVVALMNEHKIKYIATFDEDFKKIKEISVVN